MPDIVYKLNDPGMSAVACVLPALKAAIATGVVDAKRVGLHGHSWGGYETAFLVTQTDAFRVALAGAPLTDMVSMYSSVYWNTGTSKPADFRKQPGQIHQRLPGEHGSLYSQFAGVSCDQCEDSAVDDGQR